MSEYKEKNPWNMTNIDLAVAGTEIYRKTRVNTGLPLNEEEKAAVLKGIQELVKEWELSENDSKALEIYLLGENKVELRNAAVFVNHFDNDDKEQEQKTSLERSHFNSKGKIMSDERIEDAEFEIIPVEGKRELSQKEKDFRDAVFNAKHERKVIADAIKAGTLSCLPGKDGYADTTPAVNIMTPNKPYHGEYQLFLKAFQKQEQNGFPTAEYVTYHQIDKAREEDLNLYIREGQKGVPLIIGEQNKETGEYTNKKVIIFNVAQTNNPKALKEWAAKEVERQEKEDLEYKKTQYGTGYEPPEKQKKPGPDEIVCSSTKPEEYIGQYLAAISFGSKFKATPEQAKEFSEKMINALYAPMEPRVDKKTGEIKQPPLNKETGQPITDPFSFEKISKNANLYCREFMPKIRMEIQKQNQPELKQEQTQSIGRGM